MEKTKVLTIERVRLSGKYVQFFFEEVKNYRPTWDTDFNTETGREEVFLECCKQSVLFNLIDVEVVLNKGLKGCKSTWVLDDYNQYVLQSVECV